MQWIIQFFGSSVGKKLLMALTGSCFIAFLSIHLAGNLTLYGGKEMFNSYAAHLHAWDPLVNIAEWGLLTLAVIHILMGTLLFLQNLKARPRRYVINKWAGGRTISSATMPYTGFAILVFVVYHLLNFHFVDKAQVSIYQIVATAFQNPFYVLIYIVAIVIVALHIRHGFWSLFQTLGANHAKYMPFIMGAGIVVSLIFGFGFGLLPIYMSLAG